MEAQKELFDAEEEYRHKYRQQQDQPCTCDAEANDHEMTTDCATQIYRTELLESASAWAKAGPALAKMHAGACQEHGKRRWELSLLEFVGWTDNLW